MKSQARVDGDGEKSGFERFFRAAVDRVTSAGPPLSVTVLGPLRAEAAARSFSSRRHRAMDLGRRITDGSTSARDELAALAEEALLEMRADVALRARSAGAREAALACCDGWWGDCDADEIMDDSSIDLALRNDILAALDSLNGVIGSYERFFETLVPLARPGSVTRVLDLAAGHGGFVRAAANIARKLGLNLQFTASDLKSEYLELGTGLAERERLPVEFVTQDALDLSNISAGNYDIITCTQSLHHFPPGLVTLMFATATRAAARGVVFIDTCRSPLSGAALAIYGTVQTRNSAWVHDAWVSMRKSMVPEELELLARIGRPSDHLESTWIQPGHCLLRWRRSSGNE